MLHTLLLLTGIVSGRLPDTPRGGDRKIGPRSIESPISLDEESEPSNDVDFLFDSLFTDIRHDDIPNLPVQYRPFYSRLVDLVDDVEGTMDVEDPKSGRLAPYIGQPGPRRSQSRKNDCSY